MMRRENGRVLIDISEDEYASLLMALGLAWAAAARISDQRADGVLILANAINEGYPHWTPYEAPKVR